MATEAVVPVQTSITPPDTADLKPRIVEIAGLNLAAFRVVDQTTCEQAREYAGMLDEVIKLANAKYEAPVSAAYKLHRWLTGERGRIVDPLETMVKYLRSQVSVWLEAERRKREELERQLREENERRLREAEDAAMPWDVPPPTDQEIMIPPAPPISGVQKRNLPWSGRVTDKLIFCDEAVRRAKAGDRSLLDQIEVNPKWLKLQAQQKKDLLARLVPGLEAFRDKTVAFR